MCCGIINLHSDEAGEVTSKDNFMETATLITENSEEVIKMTKKVITFCRDKQINKVNKNSSCI